MIRILGEATLYLALSFALTQGLLPILGLSRHNRYLIAFARPCAIGQFTFVLMAYLLMTLAFLDNDFSIQYVAANSHPTLPLMYQLTAVWGAHEGSILLWILLLAGWTNAYAIFCRREPNRQLTIAILGCISTSFLSFLLFTSDPFTPATAYLSGSDLNPLLQDPGFVTHPPMLYMGYVGFSVSFAMTLAALITGNLNRVWAHLTRLFTLAAWSFLTLGIVLGSWWAYRVLGWGGFWFWDPVENVSLLPWLAGTALIHVLVLCERKDTSQRWAVLLAIFCFALSLLGTFLVRSGVLVSAHTFASDPTRGIFLLLLLGMLLAATLFIYLTRIPTIQVKHVSFSPLSRESMLLINSALLFIAMLTVLLGTLYPLILDSLHLGVISVGAPYFNTVMAPIALLILFAMGFGVFCRWQQQSLTSLYQQTWKIFFLSHLIAIVFLWCFVGKLTLLTVMSLGLSGWVIFSIIKFLRLLPGMSLAHLGFATLIIGVMLSSLLNQQREVRLSPGKSVSLGPYHFVFIDVAGMAGPNFRGVRADVEVLKHDRHVATLFPEKRIYLVRDMVMTKVDIHPGIFRDLYIALGEPLDNDAWSVRIYYKPFVRWIWFGGLIMLLGGIFAILKRRRLSE